MKILAGSGGFGARYSCKADSMVESVMSFNCAPAPQGPWLTGTSRDSIGSGRLTSASRHSLCRGLPKRSRIVEHRPPNLLAEINRMARCSTGGGSLPWRRAPDFPVGGFLLSLQLAPTSAMMNTGAILVVFRYLGLVPSSLSVLYRGSNDTPTRSSTQLNKAAAACCGRSLFTFATS